jgi:glycosyltransferase involved in cell wall biosynthesis
MQTIINQTFADWELIIVDNFSDDGSWELFQQYAREDQRIRISQAPREGMYANWNNCIRLAMGQYVYIATSDDTMEPDCLETMVSALDQHPECEICHTCLKVIDINGNEIVDWWQTTDVAKFYGGLMNKKHIRYAPYDGILFCGVHTVYFSITQILIRRSVFEKVGLFRSDFGSDGDVEWGMRVGLACNVLHLPETLATWRYHADGATQITWGSRSGYKHMGDFYRMFEEALIKSKFLKSGHFRRTLLRDLLFMRRRAQLTAGLHEQQRLVEKFLFFVRFFFISPRAVFGHLVYRLSGKRIYVDKLCYVRREIEKLGLEDHVKVID